MSHCSPTDADTDSSHRHIDRSRRRLCRRLCGSAQRPKAPELHTDTDTAPVVHGSKPLPPAVDATNGAADCRHRTQHLSLSLSVIGSLVDRRGRQIVSSAPTPTQTPTPTQATAASCRRHIDRSQRLCRRLCGEAQRPIARELQTDTHAASPSWKQATAAGCRCHISTAASC